MLAVCFMLISGCSEEVPEPNSYFNFSIDDGPMIEWNRQGGHPVVCLLCGPRISQDPTSFTLASYDPESYGRMLILTFNTSEVNLGSFTETITVSPEYVGNALLRLYMKPVQGESTEVGDFATVTFTKKYPGGYYDGTFEAQLTTPPYGPDADKLKIKGYFRRVRNYNE